MLITNVMTPNPVTIGTQESLQKVKQIYDNNSFHHLLVVEGGRLVGIVTDGDLYKLISSHVSKHSGEDIAIVALEARVSKIMNTNVVYMQEEENVMRAIHLFNEHHVSCLPVVNDALEPVGIVSWRDVMRYLESRVMDKVSRN